MAALCVSALFMKSSTLWLGVLYGLFWIRYMASEFGLIRVKTFFKIIAIS